MGDSKKSESRHQIVESPMTFAEVLPRHLSVTEDVRHRWEESVSSPEVKLCSHPYI